MRARTDATVGAPRRPFVWRWLVSGAVVGALTHPVGAQQQPPPIGFGHAVGQTAVGVLGTPIGFVAGGLATRWVATHWLRVSDDGASTPAMIGAYVGAATLTATGPVIVGPGPHARASYWASLGGAAAGGVGSFLLVRLNRAVDLGTVPRFIGAIAVFSLPAIGATVGYNLSRTYR
jgi:hypothetical protein